MTYKEVTNIVTISKIKEQNDRSRIPTRADKDLFWLEGYVTKLPFFEASCLLHLVTGYRVSREATKRVQHVNQGVLGRTGWIRLNAFSPINTVCPDPSL